MSTLWWSSVQAIHCPLKTSPQLALAVSLYASESRG